jgi:2-hydroxychromene-2-carboxylate isomerase
MQKPEIEYFFSLASPWTYMGSREFEKLVGRTDVPVVFKPISLGRVIIAAGGKQLKDRPAPIQGYRLIELQRWRQIRNIDLVLWPKHFTADPSLSHRMVLAALDMEASVFPFLHAVSEAKWTFEKDVGDPEILREIADTSGLNGKELLLRAADPSFIEREEKLTAEAIDRFVFGAPFFIYRGEPFWGQDRLQQLEEAIVTGRASFTGRD